MYRLLSAHILAPRDVIRWLPLKCASWHSAAPVLTVSLMLNLRCSDLNSWTLRSGTHFPTWPKCFCHYWKWSDGSGQGRRLFSVTIRKTFSFMSRYVLQGAKRWTSFPVRKCIIQNFHFANGNLVCSLMPINQKNKMLFGLVGLLAYTHMHQSMKTPWKTVGLLLNMYHSYIDQLCAELCLVLLKALM